ncbi:MAG: hypothetical protein AB7G62_03390 [Magnetospirillum sp.]
MEQCIFDLIGDALQNNPSFPFIVASNGSFEQWINWEAYAACVAAGWDCRAQPRYKLCGGSSSLTGDLLVRDPTGRPLMIETKLVGDYTLNKYLAEIESDKTKLETLKAQGPGNLRCLLILVLYSMDGEISKRPSWTEWLDRLGFWKKHHHGPRTIPIKDRGQVLLYGWNI